MTAAHVRAAATWSGGDYARPGEGRALDVAAGTGSLAVALAELGWRTGAVDIAPPLVARGQEESRRRGLSIDWHTGPLDDLPVDDRSIDVVGSSFGMIFAPEPQVALAEAARVLAPDGRLVLTTWPHDGYMATMTDVIATFMPPGAPVWTPFAWGDAERQRTWLAPWFEDVVVERARLPWRFDDVDAAVDFLFEASPGHVAAGAFVGERLPELRDAVGAHLAEHNDGRAPVDLEIDYLLTVARRRT